MSAPLLSSHLHAMASVPADLPCLHPLAMLLACTSPVPLSSTASSYVCSFLCLTSPDCPYKPNAAVCQEASIFLCIKVHWHLSETVSWWESKKKKKNRLLLSYKADWYYLQLKEKLQHLRRLNNKWKLENRSQKITDKYYPVNSFVCSMFITVSAINIHLLFEICFHYMSPCVRVCWGAWSESPLGLVVQWYGLRSPARHTRECTLNCPAFSPTL